MNTPTRIPIHLDSMWLGLLCLAIVTFTSGGCDEKRRTDSRKTEVTELPSEWISVSVKASQDETESAGLLTERDLNQLKATLPTLVRAVPERNSVATATYQGESHEVQTCVTLVMDMRRLLSDAGTEIQAGRYFNDQDSHYEHPMVVISDSFAKSLFGNESPIDKKIQLGSREFTVIGVLAPPKPAVIRLPHQMYLGMIPPPEPVQRQPGELDRIWLKVRTLADVESTKEIVRNLLKRNHPDIEFEIRSTYPKTTGA